LVPNRFPAAVDRQGLMGFSLIVERCAELPALAFAAELVSGRRAIAVLCGPAVEVDDKGLLAGAWAGPFELRAIERAATSIGTALRITEKGLVAVAGTASASPLYFCRASRRLVVSNSLAFALARADDGLVTSYPFYTRDLCTLYFGSHRYRHTVPTRHGGLSVFYEAMSIDEDLDVRPSAAPDPPHFRDFSSYRDYLASETRAAFANAADPARTARYRPLVALSAGYDSPAAAVIARDAGCAEAITFGQPVDQSETNEDSGAAIAHLLGLKTSEHRTFAYRERSDLPEIEFIASSFGGGQVYLTATGTTLAGRIVVSGYGGDFVWGRTYAEKRRPRFPIYTGGYSHNEFYNRSPAIDFSIPMIGARNFDDIGAISRSAAMRPWSIGGDYDRPIPRRLLEEAGIARGTFAVRKRRVTPDYDTLARRTVDLDRYFSPASRLAFETWFAAERPIIRSQAFRHRLISDTLGRILWSRKFSRALGRHGIAWPPFPVRLLRFKVRIRKNGYVFNWAVGELIRRYRALLARNNTDREAPTATAMPPGSVEARRQRPDRAPP
jgi:hypothetical protein